MNIPGIPNIGDVEQAGEKLEDKGLAVLTQFRKDFFADLRAILDDYQISFTRKDTTK